MASNVVEANQQSSTDQTTVFVSDATAVSSQRIQPLKLDQAIHSSSTSFNAQDIITFLKKPIVTQTGVFQTTDTVSTFAGRNLPSAEMLTGSIWYNKLAGYLGFRATLKFRIVFNATRFQMGRYMLCWVPSGGALTNSTTNNFGLTYAAYTNTLVQRTQLQRVEFDLSCDTEAILEIPYCSALNFIPVGVRNATNTYGDLGRVQIFPYVPLTVDSGTPTVSYTLYVSLEDVELVGAATPQSGERTRSKVTKKGSPSDEEAKSGGIGPVQSIMKVGLDVSGALTNVPFLSHFAQPAAWIFDALHGTAAHFGWSKPATSCPVDRMNQVYAPYLGSIDGPDLSLPLSGCITNSVDPALGFSGTDIDELDFKHFCTIPAWFRTFTWSPGDSVGSNLFIQALSPSNFSQVRPLQLPGVVDFIPLSFTSQWFKYWRGSLVFKFKIVRTEFHSGRLQFAFFPHEFMSGSTTGVDYANSAYINRHIVDVRESNEVTITIPYTCSSPWLDLEDQATFGWIAVIVQDKLISPSTVPQTISIAVEVAGGPDTEFAFPRPANLTPALKAVPQSGEMSREDPTSVCAIVDATIGATSPNENDIVNAGMCIGEKISSFRALSRHFNLFPNQVTETISGLFTQIIPFGITWWIVDLVTPIPPRYGGDLYGALGSMFLYSRGGTRWKALMYAGVGADFNARSVLTYTVPIKGSTPGLFSGLIVVSANSASGGLALRIGDFSSGPKVLSRTVDNQTIEFTVPQYSRYHSRVNSAHALGGNDYSSLKPSLSTPFIVEMATTANATLGLRKSIYARAAADDGNFGCFISIPPMVQTVGGSLN